MEAFKNLIKNIILFLLVGVVPSACWAGGLFYAFSWASFFLLIGGFFCILWLKARNSSHILRKLLLSRQEAWALCEKDQIIDHSPSFPGGSLQSFKAFLHPSSLPKVQSAIAELIHKNLPFQMRVHAAAHDAIYTLEGEPLEGKFIFWLKNITEIAHQERLHMEHFQKNEILLANLHATMDLLPVLIWHRDEHQKINYCNHAYSSAVQAHPSKVYEKGIELIRSRFAKSLSRKALNMGECQSIESAAIANEERRYFRICEIPNARGHGTLGVAFDITDRNDARMEIKRLMDAHDKVLAHLSTAISVFDADGTLQYYNQAYINLHSFDQEFLNANPRLDEVLEELRRRRQLPEYADFPAYKKRRLQQLKEQTEPQEDLMYLPDERTLRIFSAPHPMGGLLFMCEDVTSYLALERKNKTLLDAYQTTLDNLFEGAVVIGSDNRLKLFNPSFVKLWNLKVEDVEPDIHLNSLVEKLKDFFDYEGDWESYKAQFIENITDRVPKNGQLRRKDNTTIKFGYVPLPNGDHLLSYTEATDKSQVQQALQERNEALAAADHLKLEFIANASYSLRPPLDSIIQFAEVLSHQYFGDLNEKQIEYINGVVESSNKLLYLVNEILDLASLDIGHLTLKPSTVDMPTLLNEVIELVSQKVENNKQSLVLDCDKKIGEWIVDEKRLKQALFNLLTNVRKFTPVDGTITIEAKIREEELEISIRNKGQGIISEDQAHLFKKPARGKKATQIEIDLGLSLVKNLVELHGGRLRWFSKPIEGTKVSCFFPPRPHQNQSIKEEVIAEISVGQ